MNPSTDTADTRPSRMWIIIIVCAWLVGIQIWLLVDFWLVRSMTDLTVYAAAIAACFIKPVREAALALGRLLDRRGRLATPLLFVGTSLIAIAVLYGTALYGNRKFTPVFHDEFSYLLQTTMLASGHLSMPAHPLGAFFDTFYVITDRAYASQYFPGAAMMFAPGVWLGLGGWVMPLVITGMVCGMVVLVIRELFDALAGLAALIILFSVLELRFQSLSPLAQHPSLLLGLIAIYFVLKWLRSRWLGHLAIAAAAMGWMAITRPLDAVAFSLPMACVGAITMARRREPARVWLRTALAATLPVVPFLVIQLALNHQVTGRWLQTPFSYYASRDMPGTSYGFHTFDDSLRPVSPLPQKQRFYVKNVQSTLKEHQFLAVAKSWIGERGKGALWEMFGDMLLVIPIPVALVCLRDARRWMVVLIIPIWCVLYSFYPFRYVHYYVMLIPGALLLSFAGFESIYALFPRSRPIVLAMRFVLPSAIAVMSMPQFKADVRDQVFDNFIEEDFRKLEASLPDRRSVILIRFGPLSVPEWELVYMIDDAWPDDARVIRAHDLGDRNIELYRYYAERQPDRVVYRFDRETNELVRLGNVVDLAKTLGGEGDSISTTRPAGN